MNIVNVKLHENPYSESAVAAWGRTDVMKGIFVFRGLLFERGGKKANASTKVGGITDEKQL
jgi:hypothetical protein